MEKKGIAVQYRPAFFSLYINDRPTISNNFGGVNQRHGHSMADESTKKLIAVSPTFLIPFLFSTRRPQHKFSPQIVQLVTGTYTDLMSFRSLNPGSQIHLVNENIQSRTPGRYGTGHPLLTWMEPRQLMSRRSTLSLLDAECPTHAVVWMPVAKTRPSIGPSSSFLPSSHRRIRGVGPTRMASLYSSKAPGGHASCFLPPHRSRRRASFAHPPSQATRQTHDWVAEPIRLVVLVRVRTARDNSAPLR